MSKRRRKVKIHYFRILITAAIFIFIINGMRSYVKKFRNYDKMEVVENTKPAVTSESDESILIETEFMSSEPVSTVVLSVPSGKFFHVIDSKLMVNNIFEKIEAKKIYPVGAEKALPFPDDFEAKNGILVDADANRIIARKEHTERINPASLTKIMTMIVTVENAQSLSDTVLITGDMVYPLYNDGASMAGFLPDETPTVEDLLYGIMLPSGADAAIAAANYIAGSEENFVRMMNEKAQELGLKNTNYVNCIGFTDPMHYSSVEDVAALMHYALRNETCRRILSTSQHYVVPNAANSEGHVLQSTVFSHMDGTEIPGVIVKGGKTGFTNEAGQCLATFAEANGKTYIMVFAGGISRYNIVCDTLSGYSIFCMGGERYIPR